MRMGPRMPQRGARGMLPVGERDVSEKNGERPALELILEPPLEGDFPRTFGNYLLLSPLGQGGMGDVYLAKHGGIAGIEKHCVLKTLRPQFTDDREYVSRFID